VLPLPMVKFILMVHITCPQKKHRIPRCCQGDQEQETAPPAYSTAMGTWFIIHHFHGFHAHLIYTQ
jgi:hypothetical protein